MRLESTIRPSDFPEAELRITDVEAIVLRQPVLDEGIADGSQDDLVVRVHTDAGITGIGEQSARS
jgi:L-alanine-DL-glutamate epimerase-like enolase superfamily enzyme